MELVTSPARFQSFFLSDAQRFIHAVDYVATDGVVIGVIVVPVAVEGFQVEIIALDRSASLLDHIHGPLVERDRCEAGQRAQALRQYRLCREVLADEFDAVPEPATEELYEMLRMDPARV